MKKVAIGFGFLIVLGLVIGGLNCNGTSETTGDDATMSAYEEMMKDSMSADSISDKEDEDSKSLNDIRFADFKDEDWQDNDYIRCLRKYLDDYNNGKIKNEGLDQYKEELKGKFVIGNVEPCYYGGLLLQITFIDYPNDVFSSWVYSSVNEETETVLDYEVRSFSLNEKKSGFTKEEILKAVKEHPELKLW